MKTPRQILSDARVIAVVGCSDKPWRDSGHIAMFLKSQGYRVYPVNPNHQTVNGDICYPDLKSVPEPIDIVDVFRNPAFVPEVVAEAIAVGAKSIWLQLGVSDPEAEQQAIEAGLDVVSDSCIAVDYRSFGLRPVEQR
jgi:predicted CoA-binding protein